MIRATPIDIPCTVKRRIHNKRAPISSPSSESWPPSLPKRNRSLVIELGSPIKNVDTMTSLLRDSFPFLNDEELGYVVYKLDKTKLAKICCNDIDLAANACRKLVENGIEAWIE